MYLMKCNGSRVAHFPNFMPGHVHNHMIVHTLSAKVYSQSGGCHCDREIKENKHLQKKEVNVRNIRSQKRPRLVYRQCVLLYFSTYSQYTKFQPKTPQPCSVNLYVKKKCENAKIRSCKSVNSYLDINYCRNYLNIVHFLLLLYIVLQLIKITSLIVFVCYFSGNSYPSYCI